MNEWHINNRKDVSLYFLPFTFFMVIFVIFLFIVISGWASHTKLSQRIPMIIFLALTPLLGALYSWKEYLAEYHAPKKLRWDEEGIEMINLFGKRVKIPWKYILTVKYYRQKIFGKWEEAYYVRYNIPELFIFHKNRFWVTKEIGEKLYVYWAEIKAKEEWGLKDNHNQVDKFKIEGGDV